MDDIFMYGFLILGGVALTILGYVTGYMDGKEDVSEEDDNGDHRRHKRIDFDLRG